MSQFIKEYKTFFSSPAGEEFLTSITSLIDSNHEKAENNANLASAYTSRAKGNREVLDLTKSLVAEVKKPKQ